MMTFKKLHCCCVTSCVNFMIFSKHWKASNWNVLIKLYVSVILRWRHLTFCRDFISMIRYWRAGLTVASIQPKLLLLTKMVRTPDFFMSSSHVFLIVLKPHCLWWRDTIADGKMLWKITFLCVLVCHQLFLTSYLVYEIKTFCWDIQSVIALSMYICGKTWFLNLLLPVSCNKTYCQSCKTPLKIRRAGGPVKDLF